MFGYWTDHSFPPSISQLHCESYGAREYGVSSVSNRKRCSGRCFYTAKGVVPTFVPMLSWWESAAVVWLAGMMVFLIFHGVRHYRFVKMASRWWETVTDEPILVLFHNLKTQMGIPQSIGLQICGIIGSPMLLGFIRPRILLPGTEFADDELLLILKYELVHYNRKALWYKCLVLTAAAIHWFNPIVHLMAKAINLQCELSCNAEVVNSTGIETRRYYNEIIISVIRRQSKLKTALSTNFYWKKVYRKRRAKINWNSIRPTASRCLKMAMWCITAANV